MRNPTESETQRSGFEQAFQMLLMHRQDQEPLAWKPQCSSLPGDLTIQATLT